jgi:hypothetical protein
VPKEHHMHIDRLQRFPEPIGQLFGIIYPKSQARKFARRAATGGGVQKRAISHKSRSVAYKIGAGEALRFEFIFRFSYIIPIPYDYRQVLLLDVLLDVSSHTHSPTNSANVRLEPTSLLWKSAKYWW